MSRMISSSRLSCSWPSLTRFSRNVVTLLRVHLAGVVGDLGRQIRRAEDRHAVLDRLADRAWVSSQLPPRSAARSTITEPGAIRRTASAVISTGDCLAGNGGRGDDHVAFGDDAAPSARAVGGRTPRPWPWRSRPCPPPARCPAPARRICRPGSRPAPGTAGRTS